MFFTGVETGRSLLLDNFSTPTGLMIAKGSTVTISAKLGP